MSKCDDCAYRKVLAMTFDLHWHNEEDCPKAFLCELKEKEKDRQNNNGHCN